MKLAAYFAGIAVLVLTGCLKPSMVGPYTLLKEHCNASGVRSSHLVLHADGTYEQHHQLESGKTIDVSGAHWKHDQRVIHLDGFKIDGNGELPDGAELIEKADPAPPPIFYLEHSTCLYMGPK